MADLSDDGLRLPPDLAEVVARMRERARVTGELDIPDRTPYRSQLTAQDREEVDRWIRSGGYRAAVEAVISGDPSLADQ